MAQTRKWLLAIRDHTRKVRSIISTVPPTQPCVGLVYMYTCVYSSLVYVSVSPSIGPINVNNQELIKGRGGACAVGFYYGSDHTQSGMVTLKLNIELESRPNTVDMIDLTFLA